MATESSYIPAPYNGVSQAAPQVRLQEQAEALLDAWVDLPDGWRKRPPLIWAGKILNANADTTGRVHKLKDPDDGSVKFLLLNRESSTVTARLFNTDTSIIAGLAVSGPAQTYLNTCAAGSSLKRDMRVSQAIDFSIITSRLQTVTVDASLNTGRPFEGLVFIKSGAFGKKYQCTVTKSGGTPRVGSVITPDGTDASDSFWVATDHIAGAMFGSDGYTAANGAGHTSIQTDLGTDGFTIVIQGAVTYLSHPSSDFTIQIQDDQGGTATSAAKGTVNNFTDLPKNGITDGFTVKVLPQRGDKQGSYWVKFLSAPSPGVWVETVGPGSQKGVDITTMPIGLVKHADATWHIDQLPWIQRTVGDESLSIDPLFVGDTIQDVAYSFGRLLLVSSEEAFLSAADSPFRIYPATLTTQIDSDPISLSPPSGDAKFKAATTFSSDSFEATFIAGLQQQCALRSLGDGPVTPTSVKLARLCRYQMPVATLDGRPVANNSKIYLQIPLGTGYAGIREIAVQNVTGETLGDDLTAATPKLIPQGFDIEATIETSYVNLYSKSGTNSYWLHFFRYSEGRRVQNGIFPCKLPVGWLMVDVCSEGTLFYIFAAHLDGTMHVFTMETNPKSLDVEGLSTVLTKFDLRQSEAQVVSRTYDANTQRTTIVSNLVLPGGSGYLSAAANASAQTYPEGYLAEVISQPTTTSIIVKGDWTGAQKFYLGVGYSGYWRVSTINKYSPGDNRIMHGDLTIARITLDVAAASALTAKVSIGNRSQRSYDLRRVTFGVPSLYDGPFVVPVKGENRRTVIEIFDNGHIGATVTGFEWEGDWTSKVRRVT